MIIDVTSVENPRDPASYGPEPSREERLAAMQSIYVHAHFEGLMPPLMPRALQPLDLKSAVGVVLRSREEFEGWTALARLVSSGLYLRREYIAQAQWLCARLGVSWDDVWALRLGTGGGATDVTQSIAQAAPVASNPRKWTREELEAAIFAMQAAQNPGLGRKVECEAPNTRVMVDPRTLVTTIAIEIDKIKNIDGEQMAYLMNPIFWEDVYTSFVHSYRSTEDGSDPALTDPKRLTARDDRAAAVSWDGDLFEQVVLADPYNGDVLCEFRNLLNVAYSAGEPYGSRKAGVVHQIDMRFDLKRSLSTKLGLETLGASVDVDKGGSQAIMYEDGLWRWRATKSLRFVDLTPDVPVASALDFGQWLNYLTPALAGKSLADAMHAAVLKLPARPPSVSLDDAKRGQTWAAAT